METTQAEIDRIRDKLRRAVADSGLTQEEIGVAMGFARSGARQAVSRLLSGESQLDPRLSTLIAFAKAVDRPLAELV